MTGVTPNPLHDVTLPSAPSLMAELKTVYDKHATSWAIAAERAIVALSSSGSDAKQLLAWRFGARFITAPSNSL
jgi:hypothetical protein